jgi:2-keto-3-deoxy-L-rhamnonate aldolase RhmA
VGFDFVLIDADCTENSYTSLRNHLTALNAGGTPALVRVSINTDGHVSRVLELGPDGIIFPGINTAAEAARAISLCLYPPEGQRRLSPMRAAGYGLGDAYAYAERDSRMMCRMIQLDTADALRNLPEIVKIKNIDGFFFAPGDLCEPDGTPQGLFGPDTRELLATAVKILKKAKKPFGVSLYMTGSDVLKFWLSLGVSLTASGADISYIMKGACENLKEIKGL